MTVKQFLKDKTLQSVETANGNLIINIFVDNCVYGLDVDTSNIPCNTPLINVTDFTFINDIIKVGNIELDTTITNMLGME